MRTKWTISAILMILLFGIGVYVLLPVSPRDYVSLQNDGVYWGMSDKALEAIKGKPQQINRNIGDTPFDEFVYNETIYGYQAQCRYGFFKSGWGRQLSNVYVMINNVNPETTEDLFQKITDPLVSSYSRRKGYYNEGMTGDATTGMGLTLGIHDGASGTTYDLIYDDGALMICAIRQE